MKNCQIFIFTDLDGSLLNHNNFEFKEIKDFILDCIKNGIKIIPNTSKTNSEIQVFLDQLGQNLPFIVENGAVTLYYDNSAKLATTSGGVSVTGETSTGTLAVSSTSSLVGDVSIGDTNSAFIGMLRAGANYIAATNAAGYLIFRTGGTTPTLTLGVNHDVRFDEYGSGTNSGTATYNLEVDANGNVIETPSSGGGGGIFHGDQAVTTGSAALTFTLKRATTGTFI